MDRRTTAAREQSTQSRGRRAILVMLVVAAIVIPLSAWLGPRVSGNSGNTDPRATWPTVGGDLHALTLSGKRLFVSGHSGAGYLDIPGDWTQISSLDNKDGMGWAQTSNGVLVGGHEGLYFSNDDGATFRRATTKLPAKDVHALGAAGNTVYLASPQAGLLVSNDSGASFSRRNQIGSGFMGTINVDPADPTRAIAPDMKFGALITTDGGTNWKKLGGPAGTMSVAWNHADSQQIVVIGMDGASTTSDGGKRWTTLPVPSGTSVATYDPQGNLYVAALKGNHAQVFRRDDNGWVSVR